MQPTCELPCGKSGDQYNAASFTQVSLFLSSVRDGKKVSQPRSLPPDCCGRFPSEIMKPLAFTTVFSNETPKAISPTLEVSLAGRGWIIVQGWTWSIGRKPAGLVPYQNIARRCSWASSRRGMATFAKIKSDCIWSGVKLMGFWRPVATSTADQQFRAGWNSH